MSSIKDWRETHPERSRMRNRLDMDFASLKKIINSGDRDAQDRAEVVALRWLQRRIEYRKNYQEK